MSSYMTQTQTTITNIRHSSRPERAFDHLYDLVYTLSSEADHARTIYKSRVTEDRVQKVPLYNSMFSCLPHHPRQTYRIQQVDPVPPFIARGWRGQKNLDREQLSYLTKTNYLPNVYLPQKLYETSQVDGSDRYKFFRRPIIPFIHKLPPYVVLAQGTIPKLGIDLDTKDELGEEMKEPATKTVSIQTDYRDSEAQTDPWSSEYLIQPGIQPELLTLSHLCWGKGLPAGLAEVEMIERARAKRAWEQTLPSLGDVSRLQERLSKMEKQEANEWACREQEIEKLQKERFQLLKQMLKQREIDLAAVSDKRLEHLWNKKQAEKDRQIKQLRAKHIKALRKLNEKRKNVEGKLQRRDIISDYKDHGSQAYAPKTRLGQFLDISSEKFQVKSKHLNTYSGLAELEASMPHSALQPHAKPPKKDSAVPMGSKASREEKRIKILNSVHDEIKKNKKLQQEFQVSKPLRLLEKVEKPIPRPPTPTVDAPQTGEEEEEMSVILLQQLIRGKSVQVKMNQGKARRLELIKEMRTTHALQETEQLLKAEEKKLVESIQNAETFSKRKMAAYQAGIEIPPIETLGDQISFLSKELIRLQEERRIHAFVMLAERDRRMREAEESGRRQAEEIRRTIEDEMIKQIMSVHQTTVDSFLEDVIISSMDATADVQAREYVKKLSDKVNLIAEEFESSHTQSEGKELVAEIVHSFLLPEVEKFRLREKLQNSQKRHLLAAHKTLYDEASHMLEQNNDSNSENINDDNNS